MFKRRPLAIVTLDNVDNFWKGQRAPTVQEKLLVCSMMNAENELKAHPLMDKLGFADADRLHELIYAIEKGEVSIVKFEKLLNRYHMYSDASIEEWTSFIFVIRIIEEFFHVEYYKHVMAAIRMATQFLNTHILVFYELAEQRSSVIRDELAVRSFQFH
jgi:hypothetical protein